jgi:hypothetical protein
MVGKSSRFDVIGFGSGGDIGDGHGSARGALKKTWVAGTNPKRPFMLAITHVNYLGIGSAR